MSLNKFVFLEDTIEALEIAFDLNKNIILYGRGGFGKSDLAEKLCHEKGIEPFVFNMGSGTTIDRLFGGIDLIEYKTSGKLEYLVENSWMNHEYVIFEELFDASDEILEQLKDVISSGRLRLGGQSFAIKTKLIIGCTNKTRKEFGKNTSLKALLERFPLEQEVKWPNFSSKSYQKLYATAYPVPVDPILPDILEEYAKAGIEISPRIALVAADIYVNKGLSALRVVAEISGNQEIFKKVVAIAEIKKTIVTIAATKDAFMAKLDIENPDNVKAVNEKLQILLTKAKDIKVSDETMNLRAGVIRDLEETIANNTKMQNVFGLDDINIEEL
jgi:MoxR-like ATPase